ncbi:MAG: hypothetical protein EPN21_17785 [Methylococcaceae bacterium]|nr:MAG: hypothetical protein EPN21_17785 [Methylococcaceae bacterium]
MDLLNFEAQDLYFDGPIEPEVDRLLTLASTGYADGKAESVLLQALAQAPHSLLVLVALYRYYYYQHRLSDALEVAHLALEVSARRLGIPTDWNELGEKQIGLAALQSMTLLRFHLLALKAAAYLLLRLGEEEEGKRLLGKLLELDSHNRLGVRQLLDVVDGHLRVAG